MRKVFIITSIILWVCVAVFISGIFITGMSGGLQNMFKEKLLTRQEFPANEIQNIEVEGTHHSIEILKTDGENINVSQYGSINTKQEDFFKHTITQDSMNAGDTLRIYVEKRIRIVVSFDFRTKLKIEIPENINGDLRIKTSSGGIKIGDESMPKADNLSFKFANLNLRTSSGGIKLNERIGANSLYAQTSSGGIRTCAVLNIADNLELDSSSGGIRLEENIAGGSLRAETSSGGIHAYAGLNIAKELELNTSSGGIKTEGRVTAGSLLAKTSSGGIKLDETAVQTFELQSSSGGVRAESLSGGGSVKTSSGGINIALTEPKGDLNFSARSGGIKLYLDPNAQFTLDASTTSGSIRTDFAAKFESKNKVFAEIGENPVASITAGATSGGISVETKDELKNKNR